MKHRYIVYFEASGQRVLHVHAENVEDAKKVAWENFDLAGEQTLSYWIARVVKDVVYTTSPAIHHEGDE